MRTTFSRQAQVMLDNMPNLDVADLIKWWEQRMKEIGSGNILEYLIEKDKKYGNESNIS